MGFIRYCFMLFFKSDEVRKKLAKATPRAIPFVGTASAVGLTYWEMQHYCNDIKEFK